MQPYFQQFQHQNHKFSCVLPANFINYKTISDHFCFKSKTFACIFNTLMLLRFLKFFIIFIFIKKVSICDTIKENEISTPLSGNSKMLHFNANPIRIGYLVTELWAIYKRWKQYKTKEFECFLCLYLKNNICDIRLIPFDHVTCH